MKFFDEMPPGRSVRAERVDWAKAKAELMENPGQWGLMAENVASSIPGQLTNGKNKAFRGEELQHFEFRILKPENSDYGPRRTDLYGRYSA